MSAGNWFRLFLIITGVFTMWMTLSSLAKRRFTDGFCMLWGMLSLCLIIGGLIMDPSGLGVLISNGSLIILCLAGLGFLYMAWRFSLEISKLTRKNHELAMQLSLLNQEHDQIQLLLEEITKKNRDELWR